MKKNYILEGEKKNQSGNYAGPKARNDLIRIFSENKLEYIVDGSGPKQFLHYLKLGFILRFFSEKIIIQYPFGVDNNFYRGFAKYLLPKKAVLWIHDIGSLRNGSIGRAIKKEIHLFNQFEIVVAHNPSMIKWLKNNGCRAHLMNLQLFDYLTEEEQFTPRMQYKYRIHFAGNLSENKSCFIYSALNKLDNIEVYLYGSNFNEKKGKGLNYKGSFPPEQLPSLLNGGFGLVWDGISAESCKGNMGEYLRYNNPHKTSLYLAAGLPVIVWSEAAIAPFIIENGLGITVDSLIGIDKIIGKISDEEYYIMTKKCAVMAEKIRNGYFSKLIWKQIPS